MARSWQPIDASDVRRFSSAYANPVRHLPTEFVYQAGIVREQPAVIETRAASATAAAHAAERPVHYAIGSGTRARAFAIDTGGYVTLAPINWYEARNAWDLNPGYEFHNQRFDRRVRVECVMCHQGRPAYVAGSVNRFATPMAAGIGCEACHGPGGRHVTEIAAGAAGTARRETAIVNAAHLAPARQNDICFSCHVAADVRWSRVRRGGEEFLPGGVLADFRADFFVTPDDADAVGVASHGARMVQSRCFRESSGRMTCIGCHDPHAPAAETPRATYDAQCLKCHDATDCPDVERASSADVSCTRCHMPRAPASNAPHVLFTEHWIRARPTASRTDVRTTTKPRRTPGQPIELVDFWSAEPSPADLAIAYIAYFDETPEHAQFEDVRHGLELLRAVSGRGEAWPPEADYWLGVGAGHVGDWQHAIQSLAHGARREDDPELLKNSLARLASAYERTGQLERAAQTYRELIRHFPDLLDSYEALAMVLVADRAFDEASSLCRAALDRNANQPSVLAHLAFALWQKQRDAAEPLRLLMIAEGLNPDLPLVYVTRAAVLEADSRTLGAARRARRDAVCATARGALASSDYAAAIAVLDDAIKHAPDDAELRQWRARLQQLAPANVRE
jgi:tetratricopeptide (TPR) repeat protein